MGKRPIEDTMAAMVCHGALHRNPDLRILSVENGASWVPYLLHQFEDVFAKLPHRVPRGSGRGFKRGVYVAPFWEDNFKKMADLIGIDRIIFGSDWPHPEGLANPVNLVDDLAAHGPQRRRAAKGDGRQPGRPVQGPQRARSTSPTCPRSSSLDRI